MAGPLAIAMRQAGTANAFVPLIRHLAGRRGDGAVDLYAYPPARPILERAGLAATPVDAFAPPARTPSLLLTGTSLSPEDDGRWWGWAAANGVPSIGFVDQWVNYWQRFTVRARFDTLPDRVAVVDAVARDALAALGCPAGRLVVAGSPAFDRLSAIDAKAARALRAALAPADDQRLLLFVCEPPTPPLDAAGFRALHGFAEPDVLDLLGRLLPAVAARRGLRLHVAVKPHPIQIAAAAPPRLPAGDDRVAWRIADDDAPTLAAAADLVVGMRSMLLMEAALLGRPVVSLQPGRTADSDLTDGREGIAVATDAAAAAARLDDALARRGPPPTVPEPGGHSARFCEALAIEEDSQ